VAVVSITAPAERPVAPDESLDRTLWEYTRASGLRSMVMGTSKDPNAKLTILLVSPSTGLPAMAVKAPTSDGAAAAVAAEERMLLALGSRSSALIVDTVPRLLDAVDFGGRRAIVMSAVHGTPMSSRYMRRGHTADPAQVQQDFDSVLSWLELLWATTAADPAPMDMGCEVGLALADRFHDEPGLDRDLADLRALHARLRSNVVPPTIVHGDLWFGNLLMTGRRISGVVDWEAGIASAAPARDLARFALMYALYIDRRARGHRRVRGHPGLLAGDWGAGIVYALHSDAWFPRLVQRFLRTGLERLGASPESWRDVALAGIAEVAAMTDNPTFARRHLDLFRALTGAPSIAKDRS
jgi:aminoglycoside phosphotransferase (APT) family kinase protein